MRRRINLERSGGQYLGVPRETLHHCSQLIEARQHFQKRFFNFMQLKNMKDEKMRRSRTRGGWRRSDKGEMEEEKKEEVNARKEKEKED